MGNPSDVSNSFGSVGAPFGVAPTAPAGSVQGPKKTGYSSNDSLVSADMAALAMMWSMNVPILQPPDQSKVMELGISKIALQVLDSWSESLKKQAEERKTRENSPAYLAEMEAKRARDSGVIKSVRDYMMELKESGDNAMLSSLTNAIVISGLFTGVLVQSAVDVASTNLVSVTPQINFAADFAAHGLLPISDDFRAQLGLIGAWAMGTLISHSTFEAVTEKQNGKPVDERILADKYAGKVLGLLNSDQLNNFIMAMLVHRTEKGEPLSNERKAELSAALKLVLLSSALAAVYKSKTGKVTGEEFLDLCSGKLKAESGVEANLVSAIQDQLRNMGAKEKLHMLNALATYMDSDPKLSSFFNIGETFDKINESLSLPPDAVKT
ncbi:MAG TPA: hypothetical protein PLC42_02535 [Parachlamydiaceae bacterium]|nr:hypothetical protein [Parachlamydiaceae bacterium]